MESRSQASLPTVTCTELDSVWGRGRGGLAQHEARIVAQYSGTVQWLFIHTYICIDKISLSPHARYLPTRSMKTRETPETPKNTPSNVPQQWTRAAGTCAMKRIHAHYLINSAAIAASRNFQLYLSPVDWSRARQQQMMTSVAPCNNFRPNFWRPTTCSNCLRPKSRHARSAAEVEKRRPRSCANAGDVDGTDHAGRRATSTAEPSPSSNKTEPETEERRVSTVL